MVVDGAVVRFQAIRAAILVRLWVILTGAFAYFGFAGRDDLERDPAELRARLVPELGNDYTPSTEQLPADRLGAVPPARRGAAVRP